MKKIAFITTVLAVGVAIPAVADPAVEITHKATGVAGKDFESETETTRTDSNGTKTDQNLTQEDKKTWTGAHKQTSKLQTTVDPRGLGNKETAESETTTTTYPDGDVNRTTDSKSVDAVGTAHRTTKEFNYEAKRDGTETTVRTEEVRDPKGLMNKQVLETETKVSKKNDGTTTVTTERKINGETTQKTVN